VSPIVAGLGFIIVGLSLKVVGEATWVEVGLTIVEVAVGRPTRGLTRDLAWFRKEKRDKKKAMRNFIWV
jgi:hypothetical protein